MSSAVVEYGRLLPHPERWQKVFCRACKLEKVEYSSMPIISYFCDEHSSAKAVVKPKKTR